MGILNKEQVRDVIKLYGLKDAKGAHEAVKDMFRDVIQGMLEAELETELGYSKYAYKDKHTNNSRNGSYDKTVSSSLGEFTIEVPRDREGRYEPIAVKKGQKDVSSIQDQIISMYAKGMSTRDIHRHMSEIYGIDVSAEMVSKITDKILPIIKEWQNRPLEALYSVIYMDGVVFNVRDNGQVIKKTVYIAISVDLQGYKDVLGIWIGENESAKFWLNILNDLKSRGVKDILISCVDGLSGFEEAINAAFPKTDIQRCIVHQVRYCCKFVSYKDRKAFCRDMKEIYSAPSEEAAIEALENFSKQWNAKYPYAIKSWENNWNILTTFFKYPQEIRRLIYTTNPIESLNSVIRKTARPKRIFPTDDSLLKTVYLAIADKLKKWARIKNWNIIISQLAIYFKERIEDKI